MTFEDFFRKKKIDLAALGKAEPGLFAEFKHHFEQMGEKSFDHTKKYWFNKLRLQYHLAPEIKEERVHIANPLAEQTITETLEEGAPAPNVGFKPRFRAGMTAKPVEPKEETPAAETEKPAETTTPSSAKVGFTPRFKAGVTKPAETKEELKAEPSPETPSEEKPADDTPKPAYKPRFNAKNVKPKG